MTGLYPVTAAGVVALQLAAGIDPGIIKSIAGYWFLGAAETGQGCNLKLLTNEAIGGYAVEAPESCTVGKVAAGDVAAWNLDGKGGLILIDAVRHVLFRFEETESGDWTTTKENVKFVLTPSGKEVAGLPTAEGSAGTFELARPGSQPLCRLTLSNRPQASGDGNLELAVAPGCDPAVTALNSTAGWSTGLRSPSTAMAATASSSTPTARTVSSRRPDRASRC